MNSKRSLQLLASIFVICVVCSDAYSQQLTLDKIVPASPEAAVMNKYINTPVSNSTGTAGINVPIYTIKTNNFQWPISLNYHASGIRVDEISSCVGLGWNLAATGMVSRAISGKADEDYGGYASPANAIPKKLSEFFQLPISTQNGIIETSNAGADSEPDKFSFNFNGLNGTFYLHPTKGAVIQSENNVKISMGGYPIIVDETGNTYYFNSYESGTARNYMYQSAAPSGVVEIFDGIVGWYLTKVVSHDLSDTIEFVYNGLYFIRQEQDQYSFKIGQDFSAEGELCYTGVQQPVIERTHNQVTSTTTPILKEIKFKSGKIVFNYVQDRLDMGNGATPTGNQGRLTSVEILSKQGQTYTLFQKDSLYQSYFSSTVPQGKSAHLGYRLKLDSVSIYSKNNVAMSSAFKFDYNSTALPYRTSFAQDYWGFYNGANSNTMLTPNRIIDWSEGGYSNVYSIGTANRLPDSASMLAGIIKKVTYPTGGYTMFEFEPHKYYDDNLYTSIIPPPTTPVTHTLMATPGTETHHPSLTFMHDGPSQQVTISGFFKAFYGKSDLPPYVKIRKVDPMGFSNELTIVSSNQNTDRFEYATYNLVGGATYKIEAYVHAGSYPINEVWSTITLTRNKSAGSGGTSTVIGGIRNIGGLRIKSKTDFLSANEQTVKESYSYGAEGEGIAIAHVGIINRAYVNVHERDKIMVDDGYFVNCYACNGYDYRLYTDQSPYAASTLNGALVGYTRVEKIMTDKDGKSLGKQVFTYQVLPDDFEILPEVDNYYQLSREWQSGRQIGEELYTTMEDGNFFLTQSQATEYIPMRMDTIYNLIISRYMTNPCQPEIIDNFRFFQGRKFLGRYLPAKTITTKRTKIADNSVKEMIDTVQYTYSNTSSHYNPIKVATRSSDGRVIDEYNYYAEDMIAELEDNGNGIYQTMKQKGQTGLLILKRNMIDGVFKSEMKTEYSSPYNTFIKPISVYNKKLNQPSELIKTIGYFESGLVREQSLKNNIISAYAYNNHSLPIVEVVNAKYYQAVYNDALYSTSLAIPTNLNEASVVLSTYTGTFQLNLDAHPGKTYSLEYSLVGPAIRSGTLCASSSSVACQSNHYASAVFTDLPAGTYTLYVYYYGSDPNVYRRVSFTYPRRQTVAPAYKEFFYEGFEENGNSNVINGQAHTGKKYWTGNYTTSYSIENSRQYIIQWWNLVSGKWKFNQQAFTGNISLTGPVDDIRIFPIDARMTTFTSENLIGLTGKVDPQGGSTTYEYDDFGRMNLMRDQDNNVIKKVCYNYTGQPEECVFFTNEDKSGNYTRNNCGAGYTGSSVYVNIPANTFTSTVSIADANNMATQYGIQQANSTGTCTANTIPLNYINNVAQPFVLQVTNILIGSPTLTFSILPSKTTSTAAGQIPPGKYNVTISVPGGGGTLRYYQIGTYSTSSSAGSVSANTILFNCGTCTPIQIN